MIENKKVVVVWQSLSKSPEEKVPDFHKAIARDGTESPIFRVVPLCQWVFLRGLVWHLKRAGRNWMQGKNVLQKNSYLWKSLPGEADVRIYQKQY